MNWWIQQVIPRHVEKAPIETQIEWLDFMVEMFTWAFEREGADPTRAVWQVHKPARIDGLTLTDYLILMAVAPLAHQQPEQV